MSPASKAAVSIRYFQPNLSIVKISTSRSPAHALPQGWSVAKLVANLLLQGELADGMLKNDPVVISDLPTQNESSVLAVLGRPLYPRFLPFQYELFLDCLFRSASNQLFVYAGTQTVTTSAPWFKAQSANAETQEQQRRPLINAMQLADRRRTQNKYSPLILEDETSRIRLLDTFSKYERQWRRKLGQLARARDLDQHGDVENGFACGVARIELDQRGGMPCAFERIQCSDSANNKKNYEFFKSELAPRLNDLALKRKLKINLVSPSLATTIELLDIFAKEFGDAVVVNDYTFLLGWNSLDDIMDAMLVADHQETQILVIAERFPIVDLLIINGDPQWNT